MQIIRQIYRRLRFLYTKNRFCLNSFVGFSTMQWYNLILTMQVPLGVLTQQKPEDKTANTLEQIIRFCLNLNKRAHIELNKFEKISYFSLISRSEGCISSATFYFFYIESLVYMKDVFKQPDHPNSILSQIKSTFAKN